MMAAIPWERDGLRGWSIVGMNHYHVDGRRLLFVAMAKDGRLIKMEGPDSLGVWDALAILAARGPEDARPKTIHAPWTGGQVDALNKYQRLGSAHEFTCSGVDDHGGDKILVATRDGWICPHCTYTQDWAWEAMVIMGGGNV